MEPRHSKATRLIIVLIEGPRVCCGGGRVAVNCRACVIPVSCALSLSLSLGMCCLDRSQSKYVLPMVHAFLRFLHVCKIFRNNFTLASKPNFISRALEEMLVAETVTGFRGFSEFLSAVPTFLMGDVLRDSQHGHVSGMRSFDDKK